MLVGAGRSGQADAGASGDASHLHLATAVTSRLTLLPRSRAIGAWAYRDRPWLSAARDVGREAGADCAALLLPAVAGRQRRGSRARVGDPEDEATVGGDVGGDGADDGARRVGGGAEVPGRIRLGEEVE